MLLGEDGGRARGWPLACPPITALNAARMATSVLLKPTSPQMSRSIGCSDSMSALVAAMAAIWSAVSLKSSEDSNSRCHLLSVGRERQSRARSRARRARARSFSRGVVEDRFLRALLGPAPICHRRVSGERRSSFANADVARDEKALLERHVEPRLIGKGERRAPHSRLPPAFHQARGMPDFMPSKRPMPCSRWTT